MIGMDRESGRALAGTDHLAQSIGDILTTPIGSRLMRRDYGSLLFELVDQPLNAATRLLIYAATALALSRWEPRLRLRQASLDLSAGGGGKAVLILDGERTDLPAPNSRVTFSIPIRAGGASPVSA
jgi:phage baseplate assembly protein W